MEIKEQASEIYGQALNSDRALRALRSVAFILEQTKRESRGEWGPEMLDDLSELLSVIADFGIEGSEPTLDFVGKLQTLKLA